MPGLMQGKRGLIMGVANDHSIAWGIARTLAAQAPSSPSPIRARRSAKRVKPLAESVGSTLVMPCDVEDIASVDEVFDAVKRKWGALDFLVHAVAFSDKDELKGRYADTTRENFIRTMVISCYSFTEAAKRAAALMPNGGAMVTLTYNGGDRAMPNYNVMGVAKAGLEASVRYLAVDFGPQKHPRQRDLGRADPHARRRRHHRCALHVRLPAETFAARPRRHARRSRRRRALSAVGFVERGHRRNSFRRFGLQCHHRCRNPTRSRRRAGRWKATGNNSGQGENRCRREWGAEFIGTFMLVSAVCGAALFSAPSAGLVAVAFAVGLAVLAMVFAVGHISGGHFNPAVTCGMVAAGRIAAGKAPGYIVAQLLGGAAAAAVFYVILKGAPAGKWNDFVADLEPVWRRQAFLAGVRVYHRGGHDRVVPGGDHRDDLEELPGGICADRHRPGAHGHPSHCNPGVECLGQSGALDRDRDLRRRRGARFALAVLGGADPRRRDRRTAGRWLQDEMPHCRATSRAR